MTPPLKPEEGPQPEPATDSTAAPSLGDRSPPAVSPIEPPTASAPPATAPLWPRRDPIALSTLVTALSTVVIAGAGMANCFVTSRLYEATNRTAEIAQRVFEAANRPYMGVETVVGRVDSVHHAFRWTVILKNFGTAPAEDIKPEADLVINGNPHRGWVPDNPTTVFPGVEMVLNGEIEDSSMVDFMFSSGAAVVVEIWYSYRGPSGKVYSFIEQYLYDSLRARFINLGSPKGGWLAPHP